MKKLGLSMAMFFMFCVFAYSQDKKESEPKQKLGNRH